MIVGFIPEKKEEVKKEKKESTKKSTVVNK